MEDGLSKDDKRVNAMTMIPSWLAIGNTCASINASPSAANDKRLGGMKDAKNSWPRGRKMKIHNFGGKKSGATRRKNRWIDPQWQ
jgi:hypothetical protein